MPLNMEGQGQPTDSDCPTLKYNLFNLGATMCHRRMPKPKSRLA